MDKLLFSTKNKYGVWGLSKAIACWLLLLAAYLMLMIITGLLTQSIVSQPTAEQSAASWPDVIIIASAELVVLVQLAKYSTVGKRVLVWYLFIVYWSTKSVLMLIEALFFLNIWQSTPIMSLDSVCFVLIQSLLHCLGVCALVAFIFGKQRSNKRNNISVSFSSVLLVAAAYVFIYFLAGIYLAKPLGGEAFASTYSTMTLPTWFPLFQLARGILWALILAYLIQHVHKSKITVLAISALTVFSSTQLLHPNPYMLEQLRAAHLIELGASMASFAWIGKKILLKRIFATVK